MALPVGVLTSTVTWGPMIDYLGVPITTATVTIGASADITWSATGAALFRSNLVATGTTGSMVLPGTDQAGFVAAGVPVKGWTYTATVQSPGQADRVIIFTLPSGVTLDLDTLVPLDESTTGVVVNVPAIVSVNGQAGPAVVLTAASVGALPAVAPVTITNPAGAAPSFRVRNQADTSDAFSVSSVNGSITLSSASASGAGPNVYNATAADGGIRFGPTTGQTYIQRAAAQVLKTDSAIRLLATNTAGRIAAATAGVGATQFDTTLNKPVWSDGTNWRDAAGTIV